jgi:hypothetical protein
MVETAEPKNKVDYFDITKLFKVLDKNGWVEGKNFMKFWADGTEQTALVDTIKGKSTIGANVNRGLRVYTVQWSWLSGFTVAMAQYQRLFAEKVENPAVKRLLMDTYGMQATDRGAVFRIGVVTRGVCRHEWAAQRRQ